MNAKRCQPVELFIAVVDLVKSPQQGYRVKHPMYEIETQISNQDDLDDLEPIRLAGDSDPHRQRDQPCGDDDSARNQDYDSELGQPPIHEQINHVVPPATTKNPLKGMHCQKAL